MILTLTPNPSLDLTIEVDEPLRRGAVQRARSSTTQPGGKGINISRVAVAAGVPSIAVLPARPDDPFVLQLLVAGVDARPVPPTGPVRTSLTVTEPDGTTTKVNPPGSPATPASLAALAEAVGRRAADASWTALGGSLPPGAPVDWYAALVAGARRAGSKVAVDTSDAALRAVVEAGPASAPDLLKPNGDELASLVGGDGAALEADPEAAAAAAADLVARGVGAVLATLGAGGAVLVTDGGAWFAAPPPTTVVSTVGAGDSSLCGYLLADVRGAPPAERLALAVAYGSATAGLPGTTLAGPDQVRPDLVQVRPLALPR